MQTNLLRLLLALPLAALAACGGGGSQPAAPADVQSGLLRSAKSGDLVAYFQERLDRGAVPGSKFSDSGPVAAPSLQGPAVSGTQVQEQGVDEDDLLKSDGRMLYALHPSTGGDSAARVSTAVIAPDGGLAELGSIALPQGALASGMYLAESGQLAVLSAKYTYRPIKPSDPDAPVALYLPVNYSTGLDVYGVRQGALPVPRHRLEFDGRLVGSRRIGNVLYLVSSWAPDVTPYLSSPGTGTPTLVAAGASVLLPTVRIDGGAPEPLVTEADCFLQPDNASNALQLTTITAIDLSGAGLPRRSRCFVGDSNTLYMSLQNVYLASSRSYSVAAATSGTVFSSGTTTDIHKFALAGLSVAYRGSGQVEGHLGWDYEKMSRRMSEHEGNLRVVTYTGATGWWGPMDTPTARTTAPSPATLTVLREDPVRGELVKLATLPNSQSPAPLGHAGEQVYAVHFAGPRAYVVTFRRTDPLYVIDLSNPALPRATGELEMPGFSDYLFPLADGRLLGIGREATPLGFATGVKIALFDVADPAHPRLLDSRVLGDRGSSSALDYSRHGINLLAQGGGVRIALPVLLHETVDGTLRPSRQGLARYTADLESGKLVDRPFHLATSFDGTSADVQRWQRYPLWLERSIQSAGSTYYLSGGEVSRIAEP